MKKYLLILPFAVILAGMTGCARFSADNPLDPSNTYNFTITENFNEITGAYPIVMTFPFSGWSINSGPAVGFEVNNMPGFTVDNSPYLQFTTAAVVGYSSIFRYLSGNDFNSSGKLDIEFDMSTSGPAMSAQGGTYCIIGDNSSIIAQTGFVAAFGIQYPNSFSQGFFAYSTGGPFQTVGPNMMSSTWYHVKFLVDVGNKTMSAWIQQNQSSGDWSLIVDHKSLNSSVPSNPTIQFRGECDSAGGGQLGAIDNIKVGNAP